MGKGKTNRTNDEVAIRYTSAEYYTLLRRLACIFPVEGVSIDMSEGALPLEEQVMEQMHERIRQVPGLEYPRKRKLLAIVVRDAMTDGHIYLYSPRHPTCAVIRESFRMEKMRESGRARKNQREKATQKRSPASPRHREFALT